MENRIKEQQLDLFSDGPRLMSSTAISCVWFSSLLTFSCKPCVTHCLHQTELATAAVGTIRTRLLKIGAQIRLSVRHIAIALPVLFGRCSRSYTNG